MRAKIWAKRKTYDERRWEDKGSLADQSEIFAAFFMRAWEDKKGTKQSRLSWGINVVQKSFAPLEQKQDKSIRQKGKKTQQKKNHKGKTQTEPHYFRGRAVGNRKRTQTEDFQQASRHAAIVWGQKVVESVVDRRLKSQMECVVSNMPEEQKRHRPNKRKKKRIYRKSLLRIAGCFATAKLKRKTSR